MKNRLFAASMAALVWLSSTVGAWAEGMKPVVVASLAGYNELLKDIGFLGKTAEMPDLAQSVEGLIAFATQFQGLAGLDKTKPIGVALQTDGGQFQVLGFVPVEDADKLLGALIGAVGEATDAGDGCKMIRVKNFPLFVKPQGGWAYISYSKDSFAELPKDPTALLGDLHKQYDLGVRVHVQNVPPAFREIAVGQLRQGAQKFNSKRLPNESDEAFEIRRKQTELQLEAASDAINELDQIALGLAIDSVEKRLFMDVGLTVLPDSKLSKQIAGLATVKSQHTGFLLEDSTANLHLASVMSDADVNQSLSMLDAARAKIEGELDNKLGNATEAEKKSIRGWIGELFAVASDTVKGKSLNGGAIVVGDGPLTFAAGMSVVGGERLEKVFKEFVALAQTKPEFDKAHAKVVFDAYTHEGVRAHTLTVPIPDDDKGRDAKKVLGDNFELTLGFGRGSVFVAIGEDGADTLEEVIDESKAGADDALPFELHLATAPVMQMVAKNEPEKPELAEFAKALADGDDYIFLTSEADGLSQLARFEIEEGVIRIVGLSLKALAMKR